MEGRMTWGWGGAEVRQFEQAEGPLSGGECWQTGGGPTAGGGIRQGGRRYGQIGTQWISRGDPVKQTSPPAQGGADTLGGGGGGDMGGGYGGSVGPGARARRW